MYMTNTALKNKELDINKAKLEEEKRANLENERHARAKWGDEKWINYLGAAGSLMKGVGSIAGRGKLLNDPAWYKGYPSSQAFVANLPVNRLGQHPFKGLMSISGNDVKTTVPLAKCIYYNNILGGVAEQSDADVINQAMVRIRNQLRKLNSRIGGWEPGDLGQYLIAATELHTLMLTWRKAILAANTFDGNKNKLGDCIIYQCGFKAHEMRTNLAAHIAAYNNYVTRIATSIYIPLGLNYYERKVFMATVAFQDDDLALSQIIHFRPYQFGRYSEENAKVYFDSNFGFNNHTISQIKSAIDLRLKELQYSTSIGTMSADIFAAYGNDPKGYYQLPLIQQGEQIVIGHFDEPLHQLMNGLFLPVRPVARPASGSSMVTKHLAVTIDDDDTATTASGYISASTLFFMYQPLTGSDDIKQDSAGLIYQGISDSYKWGPVWAVKPASSDTGNTITVNIAESDSTKPSIIYGSDKPVVLNFYKNDVSADDLLVSTRLRPVFNIGTYSSTDYLRAYSAGTELLLFAINGRCDYQGKLVFNETVGITDPTYNHSYTTCETSMDDIIGFDWHPMVVYNFGTTGTCRLSLIEGNVTTISKDNLEYINADCMLGLFTLNDVRNEMTNNFSLSGNPKGVKDTRVTKRNKGKK